MLGRQGCKHHVIHVDPDISLLDDGRLSAARQLTILMFIILGMVLNESKGNRGQRGCVALLYTSHMMLVVSE